jgi:outer membrane protein OmpA-like peptidoglycan-associated protein
MSYAVQRSSRFTGHFGEAPAPAPAAIPTETISNFAFDRSEFPAAEQPKLARAARAILAGVAGPVRLVGHTDPVGTDAYNDALGQRRAEEVQRRLNAQLEVLRPGSSRAVRYEIGSRGERQPAAPNTTQAGRALNRRVEIYITQPPRCAYDFANAFAIEFAEARRTLMESFQVANSFIRTVGALGARGRFIPTIIDNKYWFAKLYEYITHEELQEAPRFRHPAFVLHFIPIFYGLYKSALDDYMARRLDRVHALWRIHFDRSGRPDDSSIGGWMTGLRVSITTGVTAHVQGDMATALERAYRTYVARYCLSPAPPFDDFRDDFFVRNHIVFDRAKADLLLHASQLGPFPVGPEWGQFLFAQGEPLAGGLPVDEVYRWRERAWTEARSRLGQ